MTPQDRLRALHPEARFEQVFWRWLVTRPTDDGGCILGSGFTKEEALRDAERKSGVPCPCACRDCVSSEQVACAGANGPPSSFRHCGGGGCNREEASRG